MIRINLLAARKVKQEVKRALKSPDLDHQGAFIPGIRRLIIRNWRVQKLTLPIHRLRFR